MNGKLSIENVSVSTAESELHNLFLEAGKANSVWRSKDRRSDRSLGFAHLEMSNQAETIRCCESVAFRLEGMP
jgi:RNA recognition motif-containing protein